MKTTSQLKLHEGRMPREYVKMSKSGGIRAMKKIELVVHCFRFSRCLSYFLSSLECNPAPSAEVKVTVVRAYGAVDENTYSVCCYFSRLWKGRTGIVLASLPIDLPCLLRRAIGRNVAAQEATADLVWFCDCDYVFGPDCLETLATMELPDDKLFYPRTVQISKTHSIGDATSAKAAAGPGIYRIEPDDYKPSTHRAIGGLQIVPGDVARTFGYCKDSPKHLRPVKDGVWKDTKGDIAFRKSLGTKGTAIELPNLFRIRQLTEFVCDESKGPQESVV